MRALIVVSELPPVQSGVAKSVSEVAAGLRARGHDIDTLSSADAPSFRRDEFRLSALGLRLPSLASRLAEYDVVNIHGPSPTVSDVFLAGLRLVPSGRRPRLVYTHHFTMDLSPAWTDPLTGAYDRGVRRLAGWAADRVIVTTPSYRELVARYVDRDRISVVPWGVDHDRFHPRHRTERDPSDPVRVLYLGQLRLYKGPDVALEAVGGCPNLRLTLAGGGPLADRLRETVRDNGWTNVEVPGRVPDEELPALYGSHDIVILPSTTAKEAFGIVLLEGMASGCVPVSSDLPGLRDIAGLAGQVVPVGGSAELRSALTGFAEDHERWLKQSAASIDAAAAYSWDRTVDGYEEVLR